MSDESELKGRKTASCQLLGKHQRFNNDSDLNNENRAVGSKPWRDENYKEKKTAVGQKTAAPLLKAVPLHGKFFS